jgi:hypothetical protein
MNFKKSEMKSKKRRILKILSNILLSSTSHGIPNMIRTDNKYFKIMYMCFFLICSSLCAYMLAKSVLDYTKYDVVTEIDVIYETPTQFPTITFFNLKNPSANLKLSEFLINCNFNDYPCDSEDFEEIRDKFGYISYQFNKKINKTHGLKQITQAGKINGLQIELFSASEEMISESRYHRFDGIQVVVHNHSMDPRYYGGISSDGSEISPGFSTNLIVNRVFNYKLENPFNPCDKNLTSIDSYDSDIFRFMIKSSNYSYRQKDCFDYCIANQMIINCNLDIELSNYINILEYYEKNETQMNCIINTYNDLVHGKINDICIPLCPLECDSISYEISTSFSKFPKLKYANELKNNKKIKSKYPLGYNITYDDLLKNMIAFNVYYNDLKYTKISQIPKTLLVDLISNMGGILGLFIGISFLSFGELIEMLLEVLFILFDNKKRKNFVVKTRV